MAAAPSNRPPCAATTIVLAASQLAGCAIAHCAAGYVSEDKLRKTVAVATVVGGAGLMVGNSYP